jgi:2'-5' RNA ligase
MRPNYHLWLQPSGKAYEILVKIIADLSEAYAGPFFEPHVTLLSSLPGTEEEIHVRSLQLGTSLQPFNLQLTQPACGNQYFQCLFLPVRKNSALMDAHELAQKIFATDSDPYLPHLSLLYGHYSLERKKQIAATLPETSRISFTVGKFSLIRAGSEDPRDWISILTVPLSR